MDNFSPPAFFRRVDFVDEPTQTQIDHILQLETSDEFDRAQPRSDQNGLFCIAGSAGAAPGALRYASDMDIVAVHDIGGDAYRTWQHENGFSWLEHLHEEMSGARVYTFGYDSAMAFLAGSKGLVDHARYLLHLIRRARSNDADPGRRIAFVCHGMGGLLVRQALLIANNERGALASLHEAICAIIFLGTPHPSWRTTDNESYGKVLCRMADSILFPTPAERPIERFRMAFFESLGEIARSIGNLSGEFSKCATDIHVSSFLERDPLSEMKHVLVDDSSGRAGVSNERVIPLLYHDHFQLCKHASFAGPGINRILQELRDAAQHQSSALTRPSTELQTANPGDRSLSSRSVENHRNDALLLAAATGRTSAVRRLLHQGADCNIRNSSGETPIILALKHGHVDTVLYLLEKDAGVNDCDAKMNSPLHFASTRGDRDLARALLEKGGNPNLEDAQRATPLHRAAECGSVAIIRCLLAHGADWSAQNAWEELPARTANMQPGQDSKASEWVTASEVPTGLKARFFTSVVRVDMDSDLKHKASALTDLAERGELRAVEDLLDRGSKVTAKALYLAADNGHSDVVQVLADVMDELDTGVGFTGNALCAAACRSGGYGTLKVLLDRGADVNWHGGHYGCALQTATANHRLDNVKLLLKYGANADSQCGHYGNAITAAARHRTNFSEMASLLLAHGADINAQGPGVYGNALQTAVWQKHTTAVQFLLQNGASKTAQGRFGSALDIARRGVLRDDSDRDAQQIEWLLNEGDTLEER